MSSTTEGVEELRRLAEAAHKRIDTLEEQVETLEAELENRSGSTSSRSGHGGRDQSVLEQLNDGQRVSSQDLKRLYRTYTDIRSSRTLKERIKSLTSRACFEHVAPGVWVYRGEGS